MSNLVYTTHISTPYVNQEAIVAYKVCCESQRLYAEKIGAEFFCQTEKIMNLSNNGNDEKLNIYNLLGDYDRVLSLDADILIKPDAPDIFEMYNNSDILYMMDECRLNMPMIMNEMVPCIVSQKADIKEIINPIIKKYGFISYYNVGVMLAGKASRDIFKIEGNYFDPTYWRADQDFINYKVWQIFKGRSFINHRVLPLPMAFNGMFIYDINAFQNCHFLHYAGGYYDDAIRHFIQLYGKEIEGQPINVPEKYFVPPRMRTNDSVRVGLRSMMSVIGGNCIGAEIGCYSGEATEILAKHSQKVYAIDPWEDPYGTVPMSQIEKEFDSRVEGLHVEKKKMSSKQAATEVESGLHFVYIDGMHKYRDVKEDIALWEPKVRAGGFVCGHDYNEEGVKQAVTERFGELDGVKLQNFCDNSWLYRK